MPSSAGVGLWLPDVGGVGFLLNLPVVCSRPSDLYELNVQPAALASAARFDVSADLLSPPASATTAIAAITATTSTAPPPMVSMRLREADRWAACSASTRSRLRRSFSS